MLSLMTRGLCCVAHNMNECMYAAASPGNVKSLIVSQCAVCCCAAMANASGDTYPNDLCAELE